MKILLLLLCFGIGCDAALLQRGAAGDQCTPDSSVKANAFLNSTNVVSFSMWVIWTQTDGAGYFDIVSKGGHLGSSADLYEIGSTANKLFFRYANPDGTFQTWTTTSTYVQTATWTHLAITYNYVDASSMTFYINGASVAGSWTVGTGGLIGLTNASGFHVSSNSGELSGDPHWFGKITELAIWNSILSSGQVTQLYKSHVKYMPLQINPNTLQAYWSFDTGFNTQGVAANLHNKERTAHHLDLDQGGIYVGEPILSYPPNE